MNDIVKNEWCKHKKIIIYIICSISSSVVESCIGWLLLQYIIDNIILINTVAIVIGAIIHYILTLRFVFKNRNNLESMVVYGVTFGLGILLQNAVIWLFYDVLLANITEILRFFFSKACSLLIPFYAIYYVRSILNERIARKET